MIEDVTWLIQNSVKDSTLVFVDSSLRDRRQSATPSEYVVSFNEPVRNVYGIDVLDATIPGTMYNVDANNNLMQVLVFDEGRSAALESLPTADARISALVSLLGLLSRSSDLQAWCADAMRTNAIVAVVDGADWDSAAAAAVPAGTATPPTSVLQNSRSYALVMRAIQRVPLLLVRSDTDAAACVIEGYAVFAYDNARYAVQASHAAAGVLLSAAGFALVASAGTSAAASAGLYDVTYTEAFLLGTPLYDGSGAWTMLRTAQLVLWVVNLEIEVGNYVLNPPPTGNDASLFSTLTQVLAPIGVTPVSTSSATVDKQIRLGFTTTGSTACPFAFNWNASTCGGVLGFDQWASKSETAAYRAAPFGLANQPLYLCAPVAGTSGYIVKAPGMVDLLGVRYVTLRCPEVEEHLSSTDTYGANATGVGVFKLSSSAELFNLRFDFVSLIRKPFHPIGRMHRMTLRFERSDGSLYDFKGINHTLLLTIKYYNPTPELRFQGSVLNPDYDPDFVGYMARVAHDAARAGDAGDDDEDDDPDADADAFAQRIKDDVVRRIVTEQTKYSRPSGRGAWDDDTLPEA